jgi:hypothetical protein
MLSPRFEIDKNPLFSSTRYHLDFASGEFAEDTRHQARSCSSLPQALDNAVDSVKSSLPKGKQS